MLLAPSTQRICKPAAEHVLPLQPVCSHDVSMSGLFSIGAHSLQQYFAHVAGANKRGVRIFSAIISLLFFLLTSDQQRAILNLP
jgi:hypothetical protein